MSEYTGAVYVVAECDDDRVPTLVSGRRAHGFFFDEPLFYICFLIFAGLERFATLLRSYSPHPHTRKRGV